VKNLLCSLGFHRLVDLSDTYKKCEACGHVKWSWEEEYPWWEKLCLGISLGMLIFAVIYILVGLWVL